MLENLKPYENNIEVFKDYSGNVADKIPNNLDFVYIDGNHSYKYVKEDLELYYPKVKDGGLVGGHDYNEPNFFNEDGTDKTECEINHVKKAVNEFFEEKGIEVQSNKCLDDLGNHDWWVIKPINSDDLVNEDIVILKRLTPKDGESIDLFIKGE